MLKECYQEMFPTLKTPCYKKVGEIPCVEKGCLVKDMIEELNRKKIEVNISFLTLLLHSTCRISSLSPHNKEYLQREAVINK